MEYIVCRLIHRKKPIHIIGIYHPPPSNVNQTTNTTFIDEITDLLTEKITTLDNLMVLGDFSINTEDTTNAENNIFSDTMVAFGFDQHVQGPMHRLGNTLDIILTLLQSDGKVTITTTHG